jgi:hypothetical protein
VLEWDAGEATDHFWNWRLRVKLTKSS